MPRCDADPAARARVASHAATTVPAAPRRAVRAVEKRTRAAQADDRGGRTCRNCGRPRDRRGPPLPRRSGRRAALGAPVGAQTTVIPSRGGAPPRVGRANGGLFFFYSGECLQRRICRANQNCAPSQPTTPRPDAGAPRRRPRPPRARRVRVRPDRRAARVVPSSRRRPTRRPLRSGAYRVFTRKRAFLVKSSVTILRTGLHVAVNGDFAHNNLRSGTAFRPDCCLYTIRSASPR